MRSALGRLPRTRVLALAALVSGCTGDIGSPVSPVSGSVASAPRIGPDGEVITTPDAVTPDGSPTVGVSAQPLDCSQVKVGSTPLQRLARMHYRNSVRDLLHVELDKEALPEDEKIGVFDGNALISVSDLEVETYASAAEQAARLAKPKIESLVACDRAALGDASCAEKFIDAFGERVYRRPLEADERASYLALFGEFKAGGYPDALRVIVQTMLQSPNFLYRVELTPAEPGAVIKTLGAYELASRLSYFLASTTPDADLLAAARGGELLTDEGLSKQVERLLDAPSFADSVNGFHSQWLELDSLDDLTKDQDRFPLFTPEIGGEMRNETLRFANYVLTKDDARLETLMTASYSFPQGPLLDLYGVNAEATDQDGRTPLDPNQRAGLLTQPSFLAAHAHYDQGSPVLRGTVVIRNILCQALPDPPPDVNTTPPDPAANATTRERLAQHNTDPACGGCHKRIDGIGLGFEQFDALGSFRTMEAGKPVDASGTVLGTKSSNGNFNGVPELAKKLANSAEVQQCVATQWLRFALGRMEADADRCTLDKLFKDFAATGHDIRELLQSIALSDAFRSKRLATESAP